MKQKRCLPLDTLMFLYDALFNMSSWILSFQFKCKCSELCRLQFVILHTQMFESASIHGEDCTCILLVTVTNFSDEWVGSDAANRWATNIVRTAVSETDQEREGDLVQVIPLNPQLLVRSSSLILLVSRSYRLPTLSCQHFKSWAK